MVRLLAELDRPWPPLLVQRRTYRVIDGVHRLLAARLRGDEMIAVRLHECDEAEAFVLAVRANVTHGLPLSLRDRKFAARRIMESRPDWSNRRIALTSGVSDKTVAAIRRNDSSGNRGPGDDRVGLDGRRRPVDAAARRATVTNLLEHHPGSSLRAVAALAGVSPETVRSIRTGRENNATSATSDTPSRAIAAAAQGVPGPEAKRSLSLLLRDPALRSTDAGRLLLRALNAQAALNEDMAGLVASVPDHDRPALQELAMANAAMWHALAQLASKRWKRANDKGTRVRGAA